MASLGYIFCTNHNIHITTVKLLARLNMLIYSLSDSFHSSEELKQGMQEEGGIQYEFQLYKVS